MRCQQQSTAVRKQKAPVVWGIRRYGLWATGLKNLMRGNAELYKVPDHQG